LVWENVPGVLSSNGGRDFGSFLGGLAECGYGFAYRVLDAQFFGVAQRRRRVFVVGYLGDWRAAAAVLFERHSLQRHLTPSREKRENPAKYLTRGAGQRYDFETEDFIAQPVYEMHGQDSRVRDLGKTCSTVTSKWGTGGGNVPVALQPIGVDTYNGTETGQVSCTITADVGGPTHSGPKVMQSMAVRRLTPVECERLQGFGDNYTDIKSKGKPTPDGPRYKALGNSMAVPVMAWIGARIQQYEDLNEQR
jgi:DNA (cytosine-5)-methyltransferase 1